MTKMPEIQKMSAIKHIDKAASLCAKYGMQLGNGGDIAAMLSGISSELSNGEAIENEYLAEEN